MTFRINNKQNTDTIVSKVLEQKSTWSDLRFIALLDEFKQNQSKIRSLTRKILDFTKVIDLDQKIPQNYLQQRSFTTKINKQISESLNLCFKSSEEQKTVEIAEKIQKCIQPVQQRIVLNDCIEEQFNLQTQQFSADLAHLRVQIRNFEHENSVLNDELQTKLKALKISKLSYNNKIQKRIERENQFRHKLNEQNLLMDKFGLLEEDLDDIVQEIDKEDTYELIKSLVSVFL